MATKRQSPATDETQAPVEQPEQPAQEEQMVTTTATEQQAPTNDVEYLQATL
jgi:hypothetical protein